MKGAPTPAAPPTAWLSRKVLSLTVAVAGASAVPTDMMAPPSPVLPGPPGSPAAPRDWLWMKVVWLTLSVPVLRMPPPNGSTSALMPGRPTTTLSDTTASERVRAPAFRMPPPRKKPCPWVMVKSSMLAAAPLLMLKTRLTSLPLTASLSAPGPSIRRSSVMLNSPLGQGDRSPQPVGEGDDVGTGVGVGGRDRRPQRAEAAVGEVADPEGAEDDAILQLCGVQPGRQEPLRQPCGGGALARRRTARRRNARIAARMTNAWRRLLEKTGLR